MPSDLLQFADFQSFQAAGLPSGVKAVEIGGVVYHARTEEPPHDDFKGQDARGQWWSPDYFVVVAAGQSNMVGSGTGGTHELSGNVMAYDVVTGTIVDSSYDIPANGNRDNLYLPYANEVSAELGRPVLVIARPVSGSRIDSWLDGGDGSLWHALQDSVAHALSLVGQDHVDSFLWLQGESDFSVPLTAYRALLEGFIAQVRAEGWAAPDMAMLIGELSREGLNATQNQALQALEIAMKADPFLRFVSSTGLNSADQDGVHFDGASLDLFGHRFYAALQDILAGRAPEDDRAPVLDVDPAAPVSITLREGDEFRLEAGQFFVDPDGDPLWLYGSLGRTSAYFLQSEDGDLVLAPGYQAAEGGFQHSGTYVLTLYASDYTLDSEGYQISVTILNAEPGCEVFKTGFRDYVWAWETLEETLAHVTKSLSIDILTQDAVRGGAGVVTVDNLTIRAGSGISCDLVMAGEARKLTLQGGGAFDVLGSAGDNYVLANRADNRLSGGEGLDRLYGGGGVDLLDGGVDQDFLFGGSGDDRLIGRQGDDRLYGGNGHDRLEGQQGSDQAWGGGGKDVFVFGRGEQRLIVQDFQIGVDKIEFASVWGAVDLEHLKQVAAISEFTTQNASGLRFVFADGELQVYDLTMDDLTAKLFLFG